MRGRLFSNERKRTGILQRKPFVQSATKISFVRGVLPRPKRTETNGYFCASRPPPTLDKCWNVKCHGIKGHGLKGRWRKFPNLLQILCYVPCAVGCVLRLGGVWGLVLASYRVLGGVLEGLGLHVKGPWGGWWSSRGRNVETHDFLMFFLGSLVASWKVLGSM